MGEITKRARVARFSLLLSSILPAACLSPSCHAPVFTVSEMEKYPHDR